MSQSSELDKKVKLYIYHSIDNSGYSDQPLNTVGDRVRFLHDTFKSEYQWEIDRIGELEALKEWLQGLPSCLNIEFTYYEILKLAVKWGSIPENATEKQENKILDNWYNFIANKIMQLFRKYAA